MLIVTADANNGHAHGLLEAGADGYVTKPIGIGAFFQAVDGALAGRAVVA